MARSRRSRGRLDWVVNRFTYGGLLDAILITPSAAGQLAIPLTISDQVRTLTLTDGSEVGWGAIPEGWGPRTYAVRGHITYASEITEVASTCMFRITVHTMDSLTLAANVPGEYDLCDSVPSCSRSADEPFAWQEIVHSPSIAGAYVRSTIKVDCTVNRRLETNEALYLVAQVPGPGSGAMNIWPNLRTLMAVEG